MGHTQDAERLVARSSPAWGPLGAAGAQKPNPNEPIVNSEGEQIQLARLCTRARSAVSPAAQLEAARSEQLNCEMPPAAGGLGRPKYEIATAPGHRLQFSSKV